MIHLRRGLDLLGQRTLRKGRAYERWSLTSGLASSCQAHMEDVVHCPGSDCYLAHVMLAMFVCVVVFVPC